tara:strand:- start:202 stop:549 length:348 start_codon:yes stop_codon:yes gene_type:complete
MSKELFKTIEAQGRLITELRAENEQLKWEAGNTLVDLREENELLRKELKEIKSLTTKVVTHYYESEQTHYEELKATYDEQDYEEGEAFETPHDHVFLTLLKLEDKLIKQGLYKNQ